MRDSLGEIAAYCGRAERSGKNWKCTCPICNRHSLSVTFGHKYVVLIKCWYCGSCGLNNGYTEQRAHLVGAGLLDPTERETSQFDRAQYEQWQKERRAEVAKIWGDHRFLEPVTAKRPAGIYLQHRGLESFIGHPALRYFAFALMARVWHVQHGLSAIQWTPILPDCTDRDRIEGRKTQGVLKGGAVWLGSPKPDEEFVVAEGLETVMSAMLLLNIRCGAAVLGPNLSGLVLPRKARRVRIAADNDETGRGASTHAQEVWLAQGLNVRVSFPPQEGEDFNDELKRVRRLGSMSNG
jgi:hypothetical protein